MTSAAAGLTLVEVVAGLALLSTLLVAVLTTKARATRQWSHAQRKLEAIAAADRLVTGWWQDLDRFPRRSAGRMPGASGLAWRTSPVAKPELSGLAVSVVRVEVFDEAASGAADRTPLASVEVVLDDARPTAPVASREAP
jgi:type II secretory pathway component PulJ